jgi:hypothetical protein
VSESTECASCGGALPATSGGRVRVTCSPRCKKALIDARKMERYRTDPVYRAEFLARQERYRRARGTKPRHPGGESACEWCGEIFPTMDAGRPKKFCGAPCQRKSWKDKNRYFTAPWHPIVLVGYLPDGRHGEVVAKVSHRRSVIVFCPDCSHVMGATSPWDRECSSWFGCGLVLSIEPEEADVVIDATLMPMRVPCG